MKGEGGEGGGVNKCHPVGCGGGGWGGVEGVVADKEGSEVLAEERGTRRTQKAR
jgi:hypothetical protein